MAPDPVVDVDPGKMRGRGDWWHSVSCTDVQWTHGPAAQYCSPQPSDFNIDIFTGVWTAALHYSHRTHNFQITKFILLKKIFSFSTFFGNLQSFTAMFLMTISNSIKVERKLVELIFELKRGYSDECNVRGCNECTIHQYYSVKVVQCLIPPPTSLHLLDCI